MSSYFARLATSHGGDAAGTAMRAIAPAATDTAPRDEPMEIETLAETASATTSPALAARSVRPMDANLEPAATDVHPEPSPAATPAERVTAAAAEGLARPRERDALPERPVHRAGARDAPVQAAAIEVVEAAPLAAAATRASAPPSASSGPTRARLAAAAAPARVTRTPDPVMGAAPIVVEAAPPGPLPFTVTEPAGHAPGLVREEARVTARAVAMPGPHAEGPLVARNSSPAAPRNVEVHIGRIELAVSAPPMPRAEPPVPSSMAAAPRAAPREAFNAHRHYLRVR